MESDEANPVVSADELARRVRAARGYAGISQPELAARVGLSTATLKRLESGQRTLRRFERRAFVTAVAEATGLPHAWFTIDLESLDPVRSLPRLSSPDLDRVIARLSDALGELREASAEVAVAESGVNVPISDAQRRRVQAGTDHQEAARLLADGLAGPLEELTAAPGRQRRQSARERSESPTPRRAG